jgi:hypothetical protein
MARSEHLDRFESLVQDLMEGSLSRIMGQRSFLEDVVRKLAQAAEESREDNFVADRYSIRVNPDDYAAYEEALGQPDQQLTHFLASLMDGRELIPAGPLKVHLFADPSIRVGQAKIDAVHSQEVDEPTKGHPAGSNNNVLSTLESQEAFLVVGGKRHISLNRPLLRIGRHIDNDLVIENPSVSRRHAQIRFRYDRFILQDLGSQAGIRVNGKQVTEHVLRDGDVITLSGTALIYGDGQPWSDQDRQRPANDGQVTVAFSPEDEV